MNQNTPNKLGTEKISRLLFQLALPAITAQIINMLYNIVDRIYIGHITEIGTLALTGVGVCFPIIILISAFSCLIGMGGAPQASIRMGEQNMNEAERILGNCFAALIILAVTLTAAFLIGGRTLLQLFGASSDTLPYAFSGTEQLYLRSGFCQDQHVYCRYRRCYQYRFRPDSYIWFTYGRPRRCTGHHYLPVYLGCLGSQIPDRKENHIKNPYFKYENFQRNPDAGPGAWPVAIYYAEHREPAEHLL